jgi:hypothetical protein
MRPLTLALIVVSCGAFALSACGESKEDKAKKQVCSARSRPRARADQGEHRACTDRRNGSRSYLSHGPNLATPYRVIVWLHGRDVDARKFSASCFRHGRLLGVERCYCCVFVSGSQSPPAGVAWALTRRASMAWSRWSLRMRQTLPIL